MALGGVLLISLVFAATLAQGLSLALEEGQGELVRRGVFGLLLLGVLDVFSVLVIWRQHRMLDEARREFEELVRGDSEPA
jgi:hypothetical protein